VRGIKTYHFKNCNLKKGDAIVIIFSTNIPDITGHQNLTQCLLLDYSEKSKQAKYALKSKKTSETFFWICGFQQPINFKVWLFCSSVSRLLMDSERDW